MSVSRGLCVSQTTTYERTFEFTFPVPDHNYVCSTVISIINLFSVGRKHSYDKDYAVDATWQSFSYKMQNQFKTNCGFEKVSLPPGKLQDSVSNTS